MENMRTRINRRDLGLERKEAIEVCKAHTLTYGFETKLF